jgi:hypothetical protein
MGIKYAHTYTYCIKELTMEQLFIIASNRLKNLQIGCDGEDYRRSPVIDVDVSWVVRSFAKGNLQCRIDSLLRLSSAFVDAGFSINLVCDGVYRHHSKRATIRRQSDNQKKSK